MPATTIELTNAIRQLLGENSRRYLSDDRLAMMVQITGGLPRDTFKMAMGYILQTLDLYVRNQPIDADGYRHEMAYYQSSLNKGVDSLAA